jgi:hypothetical protein
MLAAPQRPDDHGFAQVDDAVPGAYGFLAKPPQASTSVAGPKGWGRASTDECGRSQARAS